ncbi:MAG: hypothetical protein OXC10_06945 [Rhodospirillaceae bacterium]|nr:hypothetical protein [Rhodospirillaceae bacterium]
MFVQDDRVVPPDAELEALNGGNDAGDVVGLAHGAEDQREDRVLRIDGDQPVIAALVRVHHEFREVRQHASAIPPPPAAMVNLASDCRSG